MSIIRSHRIIGSLYSETMLQIIQDVRVGEVLRQTGSNYVLESLLSGFQEVNTILFANFVAKMT